MAGCWPTIRGSHLQSQMVFNQVVLRNHMTKCNQYISSTIVSMVIKVGRAVIYHAGLTPIASKKPWNSWSCQVTWQIKFIKFPIFSWLWSLYILGWWYIARSSHLLSNLILWSCGPVRLQNKLNILYINLYKAYECKTRQGGDLLWQAPTIKIIWSHFDHVRNWWKIYLYFYQIIAIKHSRVFISGKRFRTQTP